MTTAASAPLRSRVQVSTRVRRSSRRFDSAMASASLELRHVGATAAALDRPRAALGTRGGLTLWDA